jgi:histidyl-tRNA synthetase
VIIGDDEVAANKVTVKPMAGGEQRALEPQAAFALVAGA